LVTFFPFTAPELIALCKFGGGLGIVAGVNNEGVVAGRMFQLS
jgi:hypothetical protein